MMDCDKRRGRSSKVGQARTALKKAGLSNKNLDRVLSVVVDLLEGDQQGGGLEELGEDFYIVAPVMVPASMDRRGRIMVYPGDIDLTDEMKDIVGEWEEGEAELYATDEECSEMLRIEGDGEIIIK